MIVFGNNDQRQPLHRGEVQSFVERARAHATVTDVSDGHEVFLLHPPSQQDSRHHRDHIAQMRDWTDKPFLNIAEVDVEILAAGWSPRLRHVLRKDLARSNAFNQY